MRIRKLQSDNWVICSGSCKRCRRCRRLYRCDEADVGGSRACSTWLDQSIALLNNSSSALSHKSLNVGVSGEQYPRRRARLITASIRWRSETLVKPWHALAAYVRRATTTNWAVPPGVWEKITPFHPHSVNRVASRYCSQWLSGKCRNNTQLSRSKYNVKCHQK